MARNTPNPDALEFGPENKKGKLDYDGISMPAGAYLNFSATRGSTGYGFRDNSGVIQIQHSGGTWTNLPAAAVGGNPVYVLTRNFTPVGNGADTTEDTLMTYTLPDATLATNGNSLRVTCWGTYGATNDNKTLKFYFGATTATLVSAVGIGTNAKVWAFSVNIIRKTSTTQDMMVDYGDTQASAAGWTVVHATPAETVSGGAGVVIKCTGQDGTAATANAIQQVGMIVEFLQ